jgi:drug/metabolite transporter (DMT)-like permease
VELAQQAQAAQVEHRAATLPDDHYESASFVKRRCGTVPGVPAAGPLLCLASAAAFGAMAVFGKLAYDEGATVGTLLAIRFAAAAALFWVLVAATGAGRGLRRTPRRDVALALALGAVGYSAQAGGYFAALQRIDASLLSLLLYTFPAIVTVAAIALGRERASGRRLAALAVASAGLVLVLAGAGAGALDPLGTALGLGAAAVYATYILCSEGIAGRLHPLVLSAFVCTGAAGTLTVGAAVTGDLHPGDVTAAGSGWLACIAVVSTVGAVSLFFAGLRRVGPTAASILSTVEPVVTVVLAFLVFGEALSAVQLAGGALVLGAVLVLHARVPRRRQARMRASAAGASRTSPWPAPSTTTSSASGSPAASRSASAT